MTTYRERLEQMKAARDEWITRWPNYCRKCSGTGEITYQDDPSPAGISLSGGTITYSDPCPDCTPKGRCPRCGYEAWNIFDWLHENADEYEWPRKPCQECGWSYTNYTNSPDEYSCPREVCSWELEELEHPFDDYLEAAYEEKYGLDE